MSLLTHSYNEFASFQCTKLGMGSKIYGRKVTFDSKLIKTCDEMDRETLLQKAKARDPVNEYIAEKYKDLAKRELKAGELRVKEWNARASDGFKDDYWTLRKAEKREEQIKEFLEEFEREKKYGRNMETNEEKLERKLEKSRDEIEKVWSNSHKNIA